MNPIAFESADDGGNVLDYYDSSRDEWTIPKVSEFWSFVKVAHKRGCLGQGRRIAIIDGAFDLSMQRLQRKGQVLLRGSTSEPSQHGTAVALLASTVAPEAELYLYNISKAGQANNYRIGKALQMIRNSRVDVVNMSLGRPQRMLSVYDGVHAPKRHCCLCLRATRVAERGALVVASVGNDVDCVFCPARTDGVLGVGFMSVEREVSGGAEYARVGAPSYSQSAFAVFSIVQPAGVLGSSFATPLLSGAAALLPKPATCHLFTASRRLCTQADAVQASVRPGTPADEIRECDELYAAALRNLPHRHDGSENGPSCLQCGLLCESLYVNAGLWYLKRKRLDDAEPLLRVGKWIAPWSPHAAANLGRLLQDRAVAVKDRTETLRLLQLAESEYECALRLRDGFSPYLAQLSEIRGLINERRWGRQ